MKLKQVTFAAAIAALVVSLVESTAYAQGFTFGSTAEGQRSSEPVRGNVSPKAARKMQTRYCRLERHQVYNAQSQLIWRTIRVCG